MNNNKHNNKRVTARVSGFSLRVELALGFALVILLALAAGAVSLVSQSHSVAAVGKLVGVDGQVADLSLRSVAAMLNARRAEKDFLIFRRELGFAEAKARYATLVRLNSAELRGHMADIRDLAPDPDVIRRTQTIERDLDRYETQFLKVVELYGELGRVDTGAEGRMRRRAHEIESIVRSHGSQRLLAGLLTLRREEKDFIARGLVKHVTGFETAMRQFKADVMGTGIPAGLKRRLAGLADDYLALFREYVRIDARINAERADYLAAAGAIEPEIEKLHLYADHAAGKTRDSVLAAARTTTWTVVGTAAGAALLGLGIALFLSRSINRAVTECVGFAERVSRGDLSTRIAPRRQREFHMLASALNRMTQSLQNSRSSLERRSAELAELNTELWREVAERKLAEERLRLRNRAVESSVNAILITEFRKPDNPIVYVNPAFERITGFPAAEALGRNCSFLQGTDRNQPGIEDIRAALRERREGHAVLRNYRKDGSLFWNDLHIAPVTDDDGRVTYYVGILNDITEAKNYEHQLECQANYDALTGLANRNLLRDRLQQALAYAERHRQVVAVAFIDLDNFKVINDSLGHGAGDELLKVVGARLGSCVRRSDTVARLGGDEFVILLSDLSTAELVPRVITRIAESISAHPRIIETVKRILGAVSEPLLVAGRELNTTCSIGVALYPHDGDDPEALLKNADAAMYRAKELGRNNFQFYTAELNARLSERLSLQASLRHAAAREEFFLQYQPKVDLRTGVVSGLEALLRWNSPELGPVPPNKFVPVLEEIGMIVEVGKWVMERALSDRARWSAKGLDPIPIAVNVSAIQLKQKDFAASVVEIARRSNDKCPGLDLEITESLIMADIEDTTQKLREIRDAGIGIAIDDFGTGYSSLSYLARLPVDALKIDRAFIASFADNPDDLTIVSTIVSLAHALNLKVVAEGVETEEQRTLLKLLKCDEMQGYLFSHPLLAAEVEALLAGTPRQP